MYEFNWLDQTENYTESNEIRCFVFENKKSTYNQIRILLDLFLL